MRTAAHLATLAALALLLAGCGGSEAEPDIEADMCARPQYSPQPDEERTKRRPPTPSRDTAQ